jgi:hypothetical protein
VVFVLEALSLHVLPSEDLKMAPSQPTATNTPLPKAKDVSGVPWGNDEIPEQIRAVKKTRKTTGAVKRHRRDCLAVMEFLLDQNS